jgi:hypothetical protein
LTFRSTDRTSPDRTRGGKSAIVWACVALGLLAGPAAAQRFGAVGLDQAKQVARNLLDPERLSFAVVGDPVDLTPTRTVSDPGL